MTKSGLSVILKFIKLLLISTLLSSCWIPFPTINPNYRKEIEDPSCFIFNDEVYVCGGEYRLNLISWYTWDLFRGLERNTWSVFPSNKRVFITTEDFFKNQQYLNSKKNLYLNEIEKKRIGKTRNKSLHRYSKYYIEFNNKIFLVGGSDQRFNKYGDVWYTSDGVHWKQLTEMGPWAYNEYRTNHKLIVFNNEIILAGGWCSRNNLMTDIWSSPDGINWNLKYTFDKAKEIENVFVYNNQIFFIVAYPESDSLALLRSMDLKNWEEINFPAAKRFFTYGNFRIIRFNNEIYAYKDENLWKWNDEKEWIHLISSTDFPVSLYIDENKLIGPIDDFNSNQFIESKDLTNWQMKNTEEIITFEPVMDSNIIHWETGLNSVKIIEFKDTLWTLSGRYGLFQYSLDGINWKKTDNQRKFPFPPRDGFASCIFHDTLWITGGDQTCIYKSAHSAYDKKYSFAINDIWYTADGRNWKKKENNSWDKRSGHDLIVFQDKVYLLGGSSYGLEFPEFWSTYDFKNWEKEFSYEKLHNKIDIRPEHIRALVLDDSLYICENGRHSDYFTWLPGSNPEWKKFSDTCQYNLPDLYSLIEYTDSTGYTCFYTKHSEYLFQLENLFSWKQVNYKVIPDSTNYNDSDYIMRYFPGLYKYKGKIFCYRIDKKGEINTAELNINKQ